MNNCKAILWMKQLATSSLILALLLSMTTLPAASAANEAAPSAVTQPPNTPVAMAETGAEISDDNALTAEQVRPLLEGLDVRAGAALNKAGASWKGSTFHEVIYKKKTVSEQGEELQNVNSLAQFDFMTSAPDKAVKNGFFLDLTSGSGAVNQDIFNLLGKDKFSVPKVSFGDWRSVTRLDGKLNGREINGSLGMEGPSFAVPLVSSLPGSSSWWIPGLALSHQYRRAGADQTTGQFTMRMFAGSMLTAYLRGGGPGFTDDEARNAAPDVPTLREFGGATPPNTTTNTKLIEWLQNMADDPDFEGLNRRQYQIKLDELYRDHVLSLSIAPRNALWFEGDAWYTFAGPHTGRRLNGLAAVVVTHYFRYKADGKRSSLQIRGEYGHDRAAPTDDIVRVKAGLNYTF